MALKASTSDQARLLDLQEFDTRLAQLDHRAKKLPEFAALTTLAAESELLRRRRAGEAGLVEDARTELARVEADVAVVEARIARDAQRLQASSSVKNVAGLESELSGLRRRLADLEEIELAVMERIEELEATAAITEGDHARLSERVSSTERARDDSLESIRAERDGAAADRAAIAAALPADLLALYDRQRARYGSGASLLRGGVSGASGVRLLENELAVIRAAAPDEVLICPDSQAILIRTDESGL